MVSSIPCPKSWLPLEQIWVCSSEQLPPFGDFLSEWLFLWFPNSQKLCSVASKPSLLGCFLLLASLQTNPPENKSGFASPFWWFSFGWLFFCLLLNPQKTSCSKPTPKNSCSLSPTKNTKTHKTKSFGWLVLWFFRPTPTTLAASPPQKKTTKNPPRGSCRTGAKGCGSCWGR